MSLEVKMEEGLDKIVEESALTLVDSGIIATNISFQDYFGGIDNFANAVSFTPALLDSLIGQYVFWRETFKAKSFVKVTPGIFAQIFNFQERIQSYLQNTRRRIPQQENEDSYLHPRAREFEEVKKDLLFTLSDYHTQFHAEPEKYQAIKSLVDKHANNHKQDYGTDYQIIASLVYQRSRETSDKPVLLITTDKAMLLEITRACGYVGDAFPKAKINLRRPLGAWVYNDFGDKKPSFEYKQLSF